MYFESTQGKNDCAKIANSHKTISENKLLLWNEGTPSMNCVNNALIRLRHHLFVGEDPHQKFLEAELGEFTEPVIKSICERATTATPANGISSSESQFSKIHATVVKGHD
jgi:hypothetical protein